MPIELAGISLNRIHKIATSEQADFVGHRIPGLNGKVVQNMGRNSVVVLIEGIFFGTNAKDDLEKLRDVYKKREATDFLADITGQAYFSQVIIQRLEVWQRANEPDQYSYLLEVSEYVPPPEPESDFGFPDVEAAIGLEVADFMDMIELPDLLSVPELKDPTEGIGSMLDKVDTTLKSLVSLSEDWQNIFGTT